MSFSGNAKSTSKWKMEGERKTEVEKVEGITTKPV